jgi:hypothetical protein
VEHGRTGHEKLNVVGSKNAGKTSELPRSTINEDQIQPITLETHFKFVVVMMLLT